METGSEWRGWKVAEYLGGGSFGKVYRIEREEFGYKYEAALKVIRVPHNEDEVSAVMNEGMSESSVDSYFYSVVKGITSELALLSELSGNSNIVSYEDHSVVRLKDEFGWEIYLRMELVTPLYEHIKDKPLSRSDVIQIGIDICKALENCEKKGIIHRDIKPDNIFYSKQETYKLGDFGIARKLDQASSGMTKIGTFSYMAPEVYKGEQYDHTVDIYSLGIILYQFMNKNRRPFMPPYPDTVTVEDNERANERRFAGESIPDPCDAGDKLSSIVLKACAYDPSDRYQSASDMRRDLESALCDENEETTVLGEWTDNSDESMLGQAGLEDAETLTMFKPCEKASDHDEIQEAESTDSIEEQSHEKASKRNVFIIAAAIIAALVLGAAYWYFNRTVPSVVGMTEKEAVEKLNGAGLKAGEVIKGDFSEEVEQGSILSQSVVKDSKVRYGTSVDLTISRGRAVETPDFQNMKYSDAERKADKSGLVLELDENKPERWHDTVPKGSIISQDPAKGTEVEKGTVIKVTKSKGIKKVKVPDVSGKDRASAESIIKKAGLNAVYGTSQYSTAVAAGLVISQDPAPGARIERHSDITVILSLGPKPVVRQQAKPSRSGRSKKKASKSKKSSEDYKYED